MDPNTSMGRICMGEQHGVSLNDKVESEGHWNGSEFQDTTNSGEKKIAKAFTFYKMETEEPSDHYITPCFLDGIDVPPYVCNMGKSSRNKKKPCGNYKMTYSDEGPSLTVKKPLTQEEITRKALEKDMYERILILQEPRPIIEPLKFSDQHKKLLDSVMLDKLKLDGEVEIGKNSSLMEKLKLMKKKPLRKEEVKPVNKKITILDHSKAEPMGILKDVLCQVGVTTILAKFPILDIPVDKDVPIVEESDDDEEEYIVKRDKNGKPLYGPKFAKYLNCDDPMDRALALQEAINPFRKICVWKKMVAFLGSLPVPLQHMEWIPNYSDNFIKKGDGDGQWHVKVRIVEPYGNFFYQGSEKNFSETSGTNDFKAGSSSLPKRTRQHDTVEEAMLPRVHHEFLLWGTSNRAAKSKYNTNLARLLPKQIYSPIIVDWEVLNNMGCAEVIEEMLEIKVYEMGGDEEICRVINDDHFNVNQYWSEISSENGLILSRSSAGTIRKPILRVLQKMITYGLCQRTTGYDKVSKEKRSWNSEG
ncbi:hypothetical protein Tco_0427319 [Tanacetum coccineum]